MFIRFKVQDVSNHYGNHTTVHDNHTTVHGNHSRSPVLLLLDFVLRLPQLPGSLDPFDLALSQVIGH